MTHCKILPLILSFLCLQWYWNLFRLYDLTPNQGHKSSNDPKTELPATFWNSQRKFGISVYEDHWIRHLFHDLQYRFVLFQGVTFSLQLAVKQTFLAICLTLTSSKSSKTRTFWFLLRFKPPTWEMLPNLKRSNCKHFNDRKLPQNGPIYDEEWME